MDITNLKTSININEIGREMYKLMSELYAPECAKGIRWNDPALDIKWPADVTIISEKDAQYPDYTIRTL